MSVAFFWVHTDHLGAPLAVTDTPANPANAKVVWRAIYEAFGKATVDEDPDGDQVPVSLNVRFPGQYYDAESALHYNFYRTYDPATGRYLEADPIGMLAVLGRAGVLATDEVLRFAVRSYDGVLARLTVKDPVASDSNGINLYEYASGDPVGMTDPSGRDQQRGVFGWIKAKAMDKALELLGGGQAKLAGCEAKKEACKCDAAGSENEARAILQCLAVKHPECVGSSVARILEEQANGVPVPR